MTSVSGYLEILDKGFGFLRDLESNFQPSGANTFVPANLIKQAGLAEGGFIQGKGGKGDGNNKNLKLKSVESVNGVPLQDYRRIAPLQNQVSINPSEKFTLSQGADDLTGQALDLLVPMGRGQRGLIISPPKSGKTTLLKHMAASLIANHPDVKVFVLLIDERPEEVTDFKRELKGAHILFSSADQSIAQHMRMTRLATSTAIRYAETGQDVVVFIDSLTRMARAFNAETRSHGRTLSGGLAADAMTIPRRIFGAARNIENGGSLAIMASILVDTGSRMDDIIFQEFKGTGNLDLMLSRKCAENRVWPAINIRQSGTRKEHLLLDKKDYKKIVEIRRVLSARDEVQAMSEFVEHLERLK